MQDKGIASVAILCSLLGGLPSIITFVYVVILFYELLDNLEMHSLAPSCFAKLIVRLLWISF